MIEMRLSCDEDDRDEMDLLHMMKMKVSYGIADR